MNPAEHSIPRRVVAALALRCPRCCNGAVWRAAFRMHPSCPVCGLNYEREPGYFTGAMYASYFIGIFITLPVWMFLLLGGSDLSLVLIVGIGMVVLLTPLSFHYSRVFWMHIDCYFNPTTFQEP